MLNSVALGFSRFLVFALEYPTVIGEQEINQLLTYITVSERAKYHQSVVPHTQTEFLIGRAFLRRILAVFLGLHPIDIGLTVTQHGKPMLSPVHLVDAKLFFNVSHSCGYVVLCVTKYGEIGIDVEVHGDYKPQVARRFFHPEEFHWLESLAPPLRASAFYQLWTIKEACLKALGLGLRLPLRQIIISPGSSGTWEGLRWQTLDLFPSVSGAVAMLPLEGSMVPEVWTLHRVTFDWVRQGLMQL